MDKAQCAGAKKVFQQFLAISRILAGIFPAANSHQNSADIRLS